VPVVLLFAQAREAAGTSSIVVEASTGAGIIEELSSRFGASMTEIVASSRFWCNGDPVELDTPIGPDDEFAILPPVSGG
jgi:molybdopterin synthase sulfur carrier subunit